MPPGFIQKYQVWLTKDKHPSLFCHDIRDDEKSFVTLTPVVNVIKCLFVFITNKEAK
jgi:hypothetical protein